MSIDCRSSKHEGVFIFEDLVLSVGIPRTLKIERKQIETGEFVRDRILPGSV